MTIQTEAVTPGCLWPMDEGCVSEEWESEYDDDLKLWAQALASQTLRRLTAFRVGVCPVTVRPCGQVAVYTSSGVSPFVPLNWNGTWTNTSCGCAGTCRHGDPTRALRLPPPVFGVDEVKVDGDVVDPSRYWVDGGWLIAVGDQVWPRTQSLDLPDTEVGTFSVTYHNTAPVDTVGARACAKMAVEFARLCADGDCAFPATVTSLVRQGVTYDIPAGSFPGGETGIREVDAFVALYNPGHRRNRTQVWAPGMPL